MAIRNILLMGNPQLLKRSEVVNDPTSAEVRQLDRDMQETLESVNGIGLAAPQIGIHKRVVVFCLPPGSIPAGAKTKPIPWTMMINPTVDPQGESCIELWERCLSVPGLYAHVPATGTDSDVDLSLNTKIACTPFQITEVQHPGRKRGDEYKPVRPW